MPETIIMDVEPLARPSFVSSTRSEKTPTGITLHFGAMPDMPAPLFTCAEARAATLAPWQQL